MEAQTRSEENGLNFFDTVAQAMDHAKRDETVWKVSFHAETEERIRLVKNDRGEWVYSPLMDDDEMREMMQSHVDHPAGRDGNG